MSQITVNNGYTNPLMGFANSLPWDRSEKTWDVAATLTKMQGNHTIKFGGEWRHNRDFLLQTQDAGGPRGEFVFGAAGTGLLGGQPRASATPRRTRSPPFYWTGQIRVRRDLRVLDPGTKHMATFAFVHDKWQLRPNLTVDLGIAVGVLHAARRARRPGRPLELRRGHEHAARGRLRQHTGQSGRQEQLQALQSADRGLGRINEKTVARAGYGASTIPFPDNRFAFNYPVKQTQRAQLHEPVPARRHAGRGVPVPVVRQHPGGRRDSRHRLAAEQHVST